MSDAEQEVVSSVNPLSHRASQELVTPVTATNSNRKVEKEANPVPNFLTGSSTTGYVPNRDTTVATSVPQLSDPTEVDNAKTRKASRKLKTPADPLFEIYTTQDNKGYVYIRDLRVLRDVAAKCINDGWLDCHRNIKIVTEKINTEHQRVGDELRNALEDLRKDLTKDPANDTLRDQPPLIDELEERDDEDEQQDEEREERPREPLRPTYPTYHKDDDEDELPPPPRINMMSAAQVHRLPLFSGQEEMTCSNWLRRLQDILNMHSPPLNAEQKASFLVGHLDGAARELVDEIANDQRTFDNITQALKDHFENPQTRFVATQKLHTAQQEPTESVAKFAERLRSLVRAATLGQSTEAQKQRTLEEFVSRLHPRIRGFVRLQQPTQIEEAIRKAEIAEQTVLEAAASSVLDLTTKPQINVVTGPQDWNNGYNHDTEPRRYRNSYERSPSPGYQLRDQQTSPRYDQRQPARSSDRRRDDGRRNNYRNGPPTCYNCGGEGHLSRQCPTPPRKKHNRNYSAQSDYYQDNRHNPPQMRKFEPKYEKQPDNTQLTDEKINLLNSKHAAAMQDAQSQIAKLIARNNELMQANARSYRSNASQLKISV